MVQPGTDIGNRYHIVKPLDRGGMGSVYEVTDNRGGPSRALKLMDGRLAQDPEFLRRFAQEIQIGRALKSEHIVEVLDHGIDNRLGPYFVMELCPGESLHAYVERVGRVAPLDAKSILEQVGEALARAHAANVVHRDLKPGNILLVGASRTVKVLDFGISKIVDGVLRHSNNSRVIGTHAWMAPEQFNAGDIIDAKTDVWAYGLLAFYVLVGKPFWRADTNQSAEIIREVCVDRLKSASERAAELQFAAALPPRFDEWFAHCVNRNRAGRFENVSAALSALRTILNVKIKLVNTTTPPQPPVDSAEDMEIRAAIGVLAQRIPMAIAAITPRPIVVSQPPTPTPAHPPVVSHPTPLPVPVPQNDNNLIIFAAVGGIVALIVFAIALIVFLTTLNAPHEDHDGRPMAAAMESRTWPS